MLQTYNKYNPNANPANTNYPNGSGKDESTSGSNDGTPLEMDWYNDVLGYGEALLAQGRLTPSGAADTALVSDRLDGMRLAALRVQTACDYTGGDLSLVDVIYVGLDLSTVDYVIDRTSLTRWSTEGVTGTVTVDDLNTITGVLSGASDPLISASLTNLESSDKSTDVTILDADKTLTALENFYGRIVLSGTLTADRVLTVSNRERNITVVNNTSGGFQVKVTTASGTGVHVQNDCSYNLRCDGVNILTLHGCKLDVLPTDSYSIGTFSFPNSLSESDFYSLELTGGGAVTDYRNSTIITKDQIGTSGTGFNYTRVYVYTDASIWVRIDRVDEFSYTITNSTLFLNSIKGVLNEGVTY